MMLHTKYCSISIIGCWEKYFLKFFLKSPFRLSNSLSPWRINCIWTNKNHLFPKSPCLVSFSSPVLQEIKKKFTYEPQVMAIVQMILGSSWSWLYGCWIYNYKMLMYLCNQCLSPLMLWVRTRSWRSVLNTTLCDKVCQWLVEGRWFSLDFLHQQNWLPQYHWNIVESGVKHHKTINHQMILHVGWAKYGKWTVNFLASQRNSYFYNICKNVKPPAKVNTLANFKMETLVKDVMYRFNKVDSLIQHSFSLSNFFSSLRKET
jgi:hypothetical protein